MAVSFVRSLLSIGLAAGIALLSKHGVAIYEHLRYASLSSSGGAWQALLGRRGADSPADDW